MLMIELDTWEKFKVGDLFNVEYGSFIAQKDSVNESDGFPHVTTSGINNGISYYVENPMFDGNCITVASDGAMGASFYQANPYSASNIVSNLVPKNNTPLNEYNAQFICSLLRKQSEKYSWGGFKFSVGRVRETSLLLPATPSGDPDWDYMESYMKEMEEKAKERLDRLEEMRKQEKKKIDVSGWGEFKVGELFDIKPTKAYKLNNAFLLDDGNTPVLANSSYNNGIGGYSTLEATEKGNIITFSDTVDANTIFYQEYEFIGYAHVQGMYPKGNYKQQWNSYCLKFFASVFRETALLKGYNYGNKFRRDNAMKMSILLPVTSAGDPDWAYMEQYMREMEEKAKSRIEKLSILRK